uniref:Uncharacterized protein n=1 Tax=Plectus sambesii TaxID=2011161 RepID=A0A914UMV1_9BILA
MECVSILLQPSTRYVDLSDWHSAVEEELKRRATKGVSTVESQTPAIDEQPTPMDSSPIEECINDANKAIDDSIAVRATIDALVDGVVEGEDISQLLDEIIQQVEENAKLVKTPLSTAANTVKRHRRSAMRRFPSMVTSDSDSDAASIYKRRSSRLVPGFAIEDNFLNAAKPLPLSDLLESFLPKNLTAARASQRTPSKATLPAKDNNPQTTNHGMASVVEELREASDEQLLRIAEVLAESRDTSLVDVIKQFLLSLRFVTLTHRLPNSLKAIYIDCYDRWRPHVQFKSPLDAIEGAANLESVVEHGWLHLTATEVWMSMEKGRSEAQRMRKALGRVSYLARFVEELGHEYSIRAHCLLASVTGVTVEDQFCHLSAAQALLQQSACKQLLVPNAPLQSISEAEIDGRLRRLEQATMLASVGQLFDQDNFERVATLLTDSWESGWSTTSLDAQAINYVLLVSSLTKLTRVSEGVHWAAKALSALLHLLIDARDLALHWRQTAKVIDCLDAMCTSADFAKTTAIDEGDLQSLASSLIKLIVMRIDANASCPLSVVKPWIVLYAIASRAEKEELRKSALSERYRSVGGSKVQLATDSLMILRTAHSKLGERGQCVADGGRLLLFLVEELRTAMQDPVLHDLICAKDARFKAIKDHMLNEAEQCFFCLYKFPSKKKRHLFEHKCSPLELTWKRAGPVFEFVLPDKHEIPAFDDVITNLISSDAVQLLQRMSKLVPKADCPDSSLEHFDNYVGNLSRLGEDWPTLDSGSATSDRWIVGEMYYLMGDYCFKTGDFARAIDYYRRHLIVAGRSDHSFNSWGGCALAGAAILATYLQHSDSFATTYLEMKKLSTATLFAFETALSINASHRILHTEYADAAYQLRAHLARGLRTLGLDDSRRNEIKQRCSALLANAKEHFHCALLLIGQDGTTSGGSESWLCRYFLGKIGEKEGASPSEVLSNYHRSAVLMMRDGARYADRINYKPKRYELESLEVHYRVHAAVIKWLTKREQWPLTDLRVMLRYLHMFVEHGVSRRKVTENDRNAAWYRFHEDPEVVGTLDSIMDELPDEAEGDVEACVSDLVERVAIEEELFEMCIEGMKLCIRRFQNHYYKAFYRLAQCYFSVDCVQNVKRASLVLFGPICRKELGLSSGLFQSRKPTNFFENLWRIPVEEIDRNGSFPMHMARCCWLAIAIASKLEDYAALIDIVVPLSRKPTDPKLQYVSEQNRNKLCNAASRCGLRAAHQWLKRSRPDNNLKRFCIQVYQAVRLLVKNRAPFADAWNDLLRAAFKPLMSSLPANSTNLDTQIMEQCEAWIAQSTEKKRANSLAHRFDSAAKRRRVEEIAPTSQRQLQKQLKRALPSDDHHGATMVSVGAVDSSTVEESPAKVARVNSDQSRNGRFSVDDLLTVSSSQDSQHSTISDSNIPDEPADDASLSADIPRSAGSSDKPIFLDDSF